MNTKLFLTTAMGISLALGALTVAAQNTNRPRSTEVAPRAEAAPAKPNWGNGEQVLAQVTQNAGVRTCKPLADKVNRYLIADSQSSGVLFIAPENANGHVFSGTLEIESKQGSTTYASASYAPYGEVGCGVAYDAVTYWKESCAEVSSKVLKELRPLGPLGSKITMLDGGPAMRMFLMPAGAGCIQIKKEVLY
jgi:hypothetical protein